MNITLSRLLFFFLFASCTTLFSQTEEYPWQLSIGFNAVDTFPTDVVNQGALLEEFFNVKDHWNIAPSATFVGFSNYLGNGFSFGMRLSFNTITKYGNIAANEDFFGALDGLLKYDLNVLLKTKRFNPYFETGGSYVFFDKVSAGYFNLGFGIEYALGKKRKTIVFAETLFRNTGETYGEKNFQHSLGIAFRYGNNHKDNDGIIDKQDKCPDVSGLKKFEGCPDSDEDGIIDIKDNCPTVYGLALFQGCPDSDADGIEDVKDDCPKVYGLASFQGCPDTDGDGIKDSDDACPFKVGLASFSGCPDTDGDGIEDALDKCPEIEGVPDYEGCPEFSEEIIEELDEISQLIYFKTNSYILNENDKKIIDRVYEILKKHSYLKVKILGHTDAQGEEEYNIKLSESRAQSVTEYLLFRGISSDRIHSKGYGENSPVESNSSEQGRALNRRVEFVIIKN